jgi:glyoxalase family protein
MRAPILGLHHVTATVDDAQADVDFACAALGLRLVKKTVNFDNHGVYHFYYGDERGRPGSLWTTFPYRDRGVATGVRGEGQVTVTSFSVPASALQFWAERLRDRGVPVEEADRFGEPSIVARDPSGLAIELVGTTRDPREPWSGAGIDEGHAVRGLHGVTLTVQDAAPTIEFMRGLFPIEVLKDVPGRTRLGVGGDGPGRIVDVQHGSGAAAARNGLGTVHHVALAISDSEAQLRLREHLVASGVRVTPVMDRQYFKSIYFREPGGVLLEVATLDPGFLVDEPLPDLGRGLKLPPWEEPFRAEIEGQLPRISTGP